MPFVWRINIVKNPTDSGPALFQFEETPQIQVGDQVFWSNTDTVPHWPALTDNQTYFMDFQIAAKSTSPSFSPKNPGTTINYVCSLHPGETGSIVVQSPPPPDVAAGS